LFRGPDGGVDVVAGEALLARGGRRMCKDEADYVSFADRKERKGWKKARMVERAHRHRPHTPSISATHRRIQIRPVRVRRIGHDRRSAARQTADGGGGGEGEGGGVGWEAAAVW
jgi:hypothetical protein